MRHIHPQLTASRSQPEKKEGKESEEKWKVKISCLENGQTLHDSTNKQELFGFISNKVASVHCPENKEMFIKLGSTAIIRGSNRSMGPCNHKEAGTRFIVHL